MTAARLTNRQLQGKACLYAHEMARMLPRIDAIPDTVERAELLALVDAMAAAYVATRYAVGDLVREAST